MSSIPFDQLVVLWDDGERRLRTAAPRERRLMEQIVDVIVLELRRRLGGPFQTEQLAALYLEGTDWCFDLATQVMPGSPEAWDMPTVVGSAFTRYVRRATDFGGGRRRLEDQDA
ncbi:MAG TPA: hypothetical protein VFN48_08650 [Solirubrobacteraceae bacterium]|nr:hypothetical protein [Solirubrobacteraceae bacterium]